MRTKKRKLELTSANEDEQDMWWINPTDDEDQTEEDQGINTTTTSNNNNFLAWLSSGDLSDVVLISLQSMKEERYRAHKLLLGQNSLWFKNLFQEKPAIDNVAVTDPFGVLPQVLAFVYSGELGSEISATVAVGTLQFARTYSIAGLQEHIVQLVRVQLSPLTVLAYLTEAFQHKCEELRDVVLMYLCRRFELLSSSFYFNSLTPEQLMMVLTNDNLFVESEHTVYKTVCLYISSRNDLTPEMRAQLLSWVRFSQMSSGELHEASQNPLVPKELVVEGMAVRLWMVEQGGDGKYPFSEIHCKRDQSRKTDTRLGGAKKFTYASDFDTNGIVYFLGIGCDPKQTVWQNPHTTGALTLSASSGDSGYDISLCLNRTDQARRGNTYYSACQPSQWVVFDFGAKNSSFRLHPTHYTLRTGANGSYALRNWNLEGSEDQKTWELLAVHTQDASLSRSTATKTWALPHNTPSANKKKQSKAFYRYLRISSTGPDASGSDYLELNGFEVYGAVRMRKQAKN